MSPEPRKCHQERYLPGSQQGTEFSHGQKDTQGKPGLWLPLMELAVTGWDQQTALSWFLFSQPKAKQHKIFEVLTLVPDPAWPDPSFEGEGGTDRAKGRKGEEGRERERGREKTENRE